MDTHKPGHPLHAETIMSVKALQDELAHIDKQISKSQQAKKNLQARIQFLKAGNLNKESWDSSLYTKAVETYGTKGNQYRDGKLLNTSGFKSGDMITLYNVWIPQKYNRKYYNKKYFQQVDGAVIGTTKDFCWIFIDDKDTKPFRKKNKFVVKKE